MKNEYELIRQVRDQEKLRESFFELAEEVFGLSFRGWYENGFWTDRYIPYALADGGRVIANASVNIIDTVWQGKNRRYLQIGTVMTHPDYRGQGLMRKILEQILAEWEERCDGIYLYANDSVLDFYPKFGFCKAQEYEYRITAGSSGPDSSWQKLPMTQESAEKEKVQAARKLLGERYSCSNPYSALPMADNFGLLMFYCADFLKDCVYYSPRLDLVCVAQQDGDMVCLYDVFGRADVGLDVLAGSLPFADYSTVVLGFTPKGADGYSCSRHEEEDTTLFVYEKKENIFAAARVRMPELSHA